MASDPVILPIASVRAPGGLGSAQPELQRVEVAGVGTLTAVVVGVTVIAGLYVARAIMIPVILAVLLSFVLAPLAGRLRRVGLPRVPAVFLTILVALCVILGAGALVGTQIADLASKAPEYQATVETKAADAEAYALSKFNAVTRAFVNGKPGDPQAAKGSSPKDRSTPGKALMDAIEAGSGTGGTGGPIGMVVSIIGPVLAPLGTLAIVALIAVFILLQREDLRDRMIRLVGSSDLHRTTVAMDDAASRLSRYFVTQLAINSGFAVAIGLGLTVIGVPSPVLWGILAGLLRFVPYIGSAIAAVVPMLLAAAVSPGWSMMLETGALFLLLDAIIGQGIEPLAYGSSTGLSPLSVVVAALFWSWLWGPIGLILSMPMTLCLVVLGRHVEHLEFLDVLLGDRPALTPVEAFYQRILADDPDEVEEQAETLLKTRGLTAYYDEVALRGLQLAAADAARGVLSPAQLARVRTAIDTLIESLSAHGDAPSNGAPDPSGGTATVAGDPPQEDRATPDDPERSGEDAGLAWLREAYRAEGSIMCVAGRGALDEAAACMLAQVLGKHGLSARVVPQAAVTRQAIDRLDLSGVAMICVSYLELAGSLANLRYLVQRIRARAPGAKLLVGMWPTDDRMARDQQAQAVIGADVFVSSLQEALSACLAQATADPAPAPLPAAAPKVAA